MFQKVSSSEEEEIMKKKRIGLKKKNFKRARSKTGLKGRMKEEGLKDTSK